MRTRSFSFLLLFFLLLVPLLTNCSPSADVETQAVEISALPGGTQISTLTPVSVSSKPAASEETNTPASNEILAGEDEPTPANTAISLPTEDLRQDPQDWRNWSIIPEYISGRAREIYQKGIMMGNDPHAFSVTGDCQAIREVMLGEFDDPRKYTLKSDELYLQEAIDQFQGSFNRNGAAVRGGFTAASVLSPIHADPKECKSGETPLGCEFRLHNPSILIISLEVWNDRANLDRYELYLRQIIEYSIEEGVLPVLMTKADMAEALQHVINPTLVQLAYEYDLPLVNFWLAVQPLPNHGIDPDRDGFHISEEAWWVKSLTALKALDAVWRGVQVEPAGMPSLTETPLSPTLQPSPHPTATQTVQPLTLCNPPQDCVLLGVTHAERETLVNDGIFLFDVQTGQAAQVGGSGYRLQAVSPDGRQMLANHDGSLVLLQTNGTHSREITTGFSGFGSQGAYWLPDGKQIVLLAARENMDTEAVWLYDLKNDTWQRISGEDDRPIALYPSPDPTRVYWEAGACSAQDECTKEGVWVTETGNPPYFEEGVLLPAYSPDGVHFAFMDPAYTYEYQFDSNFRLLLENLETRLVSRRMIAFPPANGYLVRNRLESYTWSPDSSKIMIFLDERSNYYEKSAGYHTYLFVVKNGLLLEYERLFGEVPRVAWSPDSTRLFFANTVKETDGSFSIRFRQLDTKTGIAHDFDAIPVLSGKNYLFIDRMSWLPDLTSGSAE